MAYPPPAGGYPPPQGGYGGPPPGQAPQRWVPGTGPAPQWDNAPQEPVIDNPNAGPPPPPQMNAQMPQFQGYGGIAGFDTFAAMPPPPPPPPPSGDPPTMEFDKLADLGENECRDAMMDFVSQNCCYGSKPAKEHKINNTTPSTALHYILETYAEARLTAWKHEPFRGQPIDGPENGVPPPPWAIPCQPDQLFHDHRKYIEVPHTATVKPCHHCDGRGFLRCYRCHGRGQVRCGSCGGDGRVRRYDPQTQQHRQERCFSCGGDGRRRCFTCGGDGRITCSTCDGYARLKCYLQLEVKFTNHKEDHILESTDMPDELVREAGGTIIFQQQMFQVWPIRHYPIQEIAQNSVRLVDSHRTKFPSERLLQQRQTLRGIPVTEVAAQWEDWKSRYWVYGQERHVHCPDYPQQCCWGCTVL